MFGVTLDAQRARLGQHLAVVTCWPELGMESVYSSMPCMLKRVDDGGMTANTGERELVGTHNGVDHHKLPPQ
jgi:hypothetical protein